MAYTVQQLSDLEDIKVVKHRYFRGVDTVDMDLLGTLFTEDVVVDYLGGDYHVRLEGRENMLKFLHNSFHSGAVAMHHGHMPEIAFTGSDSADGIWYLEDIFIDREKGNHTWGTALYRDVYRRENGDWKIAKSVYERVSEVIWPIREDANITVQHLAEHGLKPEEREDISNLIKWS
jgi:hypothetical protein